MRNTPRLERALRFGSMTGLIAAFLLDASIRHLLSRISNESRMDQFRKKGIQIQRYSRLALRVLGIDPGTNAVPVKSGLVVSNHLSYTDILVISSKIPALYITSVETGTAGWIGALCKVAGCLFVERRKVSTLQSELIEMDSVLQAGIPLVLFPEATSTDGKDVLPFRSSLYECAIRTKVPVHALCLRYQPENSGVPYHGDMTLLTHLHSLCDGRPRSATLDFLDTVDPSDHLDRKGVASRTHQKIRQAYVSRMA